MTNEYWTIDTMTKYIYIENFNIPLIFHMHTNLKKSINRHGKLLIISNNWWLLVRRNCCLLILEYYVYFVLHSGRRRHFNSYYKFIILYYRYFKTYLLYFCFGAVFFFVNLQFTSILYVYVLSFYVREFFVSCLVRSSKIIIIFLFFFLYKNFNLTFDNLNFETRSIVLITVIQYGK